MQQKLLRAAMVAAMVFALGVGAQAADYIFAGGGGGGGGDAAANDGDGGGKGGAGGLADDDGNGTDNVSSGGGDGGDGATGSGSGGGAGTGGSSGGTGGGVAGANGDNQGAADDNGEDGTDGVNADGTGAKALDVATPTASDTIQLLGGSGGKGGIGVTTVGKGGAGGKGGDAVVELKGGVAGKATAVADITLTAGDGADGGATDAPDLGGNGGAGGDVKLTLDDSITELTVDAVAIVVTAGDAGAGSGTDATLVNGGKGGNAEFDASGKTIILDNSSTITLSRGDTATNGVGGDAIFKVGVLKAGTTGTNKLSIVNEAAGAGVGKRNIEIGEIDATLGNLSLDFTSLDMTNVDESLRDSLSIGDITVGAGKTLDNTAAFMLGTASGWTGSLNTIDNVTVNGLNLAGKAINATLTGDGSGANGTFNLSTGTVISGTSTVTATTTVNLTLDASMGEAILADDAKTITLFNTSDITGEETILADSVSISSGVYGKESVDYDPLTGKLSNIKLVMNTGSDGLAYNALLSAPAVVTLVNGGGDVVEKVTSAFSPMSFRQNSALSGVQFGAFASLGGGHTEVDTGSGVDSNNFHMLVGPGLRIATGTGTTDFGAFFEAGWGGYDAYNATYRGEGDSSYYGGGLLLRHETCSGLYGEASLRIGGADSKYGSRDDDAVDFDLRSTYFGGHAGLGYIFRPTSTSSFDISAKGLLTHVGSDSATDKLGYDIDVDSTTSVRTQLGVKYSYNFLPNASVFVKGVWEHEFDGETGGRYDNVRIQKNSDMGGSSAIGEIGVNWKAAERVTLGASVYGTVGRRQGFGGNVNVGLGF